MSKNTYMLILQTNFQQHLNHLDVANVELCSILELFSNPDYNYSTLFNNQGPFLNSFSFHKMNVRFMLFNASTLGDEVWSSYGRSYSCEKLLDNCMN